MKNIRILIVEHEIDIALEIEQYLLKFGYTVSAIVDTGESAIEKIESNTPSLILMSIRTRGDLDGIETAEIIRNRFGIPVLFTTSFLDEKRIQRVKLTMPFGYIMKPVEEKELKLTLERALYVSDIEAKRKIAETGLQESESRISSIFRAAPTGIGMVKDRVISEVNEKFCQMVGYSREELIGENSIMVYPSEEEFQKVGSGKYQQIAEQGTGIVETRLQHKDGSIIDVLLASTPIDINDLSKGVTFTALDITRRLQAERALLESEQRYKNTFKTSPDSVNINRLDGLYVDINDGFTNLTGFTRDDVIGKLSAEIDIWAIPEDREKLVNDLKEKGFVKNIESVFRCKDGSLKTALMSACIVKLDNEPHILSITRDITERNKDREALKQSNDNLKKAQEIAKMGSFQWNLETDEVFLSEEGYRIYGLDPEPPGTPLPIDFFEGIFHPDGSKTIQKLINQGAVDHNPIREEFRFLDRQGNEQFMFTEIQFLLDENETPVKCFGVFQDITEQKQMLTAAREQEAQYSLLFERSSDAIFKLDLETEKILDANNSAEKLTGRTKLELQNLTCNQIIRHDNAMHLDQARETNEATDLGEITYVRPDGSMRVAIVTLVPINNKTAFGMARDITEERKTNELMIQTEKMMSVGGLAAGMAHELNNPLGVIMQGAQNMERRLSTELKKNRQAAAKTGIDLKKLQDYLSERKIQDNLKWIKDSALKAAEIIKDMLQFSRKSESQMVDNDLAVIMDKVLELAGKDFDLKKKFDFRNINIVKKFDPDMPLVPCTETEIEQVLLNLVSNAAQAMNLTNGSTPPEITLKLSTENGMARIEISDNGPGMNEKTRKRIFEPFFTTKPVGEGTGLGLSVSFMIITNNHKGSMEVDSLPGLGTRFIIKLPLVREE